MARNRKRIALPSPAAKAPPAPETPAPEAASGAPGRRTQLERALSKLGYCSRGQAAVRIAAGKVRVNGRIARDASAWVDLGKDRIEVSGTGKGPGPAAPDAPEPAGGAKRYFRMHKPAGYVTTRRDELGRKTVYDLLPPDVAGWLFPVGRLDRDSEGLLLFTDDGGWSDRLSSPDRHVDKRYRVKLDGRPRAEELEAFRSGLVIGGRRTAPSEVEPQGGSWYLVTLREGRNRQIRRMFHALGYKVKRLVRVAIGPLELGDLPAGAVEPLDRARVEALARAGGRSRPAADAGA